MMIARPTGRECDRDDLRPLESSGRGGSGQTQMGQTVLPENPALARRKLSSGKAPVGGGGNPTHDSDQIKSR